MCSSPSRLAERFGPTSTLVSPEMKAWLLLIALAAVLFGKPPRLRPTPAEGFDPGLWDNSSSTSNAIARQIFEGLLASRRPHHAGQAPGRAAGEVLPDAKSASPFTLRPGV